MNENNSQLTESAESPTCRRCGGTDDLKDRGMAPGMAYCKWCREFLSVRDERDRLWNERRARNAGY
jgi:late competence protein required for DNA uptake (superfamily II DNA/RNA helicase)